MLSTDYSLDILILMSTSQRHSVLSRAILGIRRLAERGRLTLHSLTAFKRAVRKAHSDLMYFGECTANYDFDTWLQGMESKLEHGLSKHLQYQLRRGGDGIILARSKPRMSEHVAYSPWLQIWLVPLELWARRGQRPSTPQTDAQSTGSLSSPKVERL